MKERRTQQLDAIYDALAASHDHPTADELFRRVRQEMDEHGIHTYPPGPWHAGLEPFPDAPPAETTPLVPTE